MSAFHSYTDYKPTGVSWIESIPTHWEMKKINDLFSERSEKCSDKDFMPLSVTKFGVTKQHTRSRVKTARYGCEIQGQ